MDEIGKAVGLTRERVRQILVKSNGPTAEDARDARTRVARSADAFHYLRLRNYLERVGASSYESAASTLDMAIIDIRRLWPADLRSHVIDERSYEPVWSDEQVISALSLGSTFDYPLRASRYTALLRSGEVVGPSAARLLQRFGTWRKACEFAGVEAGKAPRENYQSKWTNSDLLEVVREYLNDPNERGSFAEFDRWRREQSEEGPSSATLRNRLGQWSSIKRQALS